MVRLNIKEDSLCGIIFRFESSNSPAQLNKMNKSSPLSVNEAGSELGDCVFNYLPKAGGVNRLCVVLLAEVQVVHVESTARDTHPLRHLVVLLQPGNSQNRSR